MANESKVIRKTDDSAMTLLHDMLGEEASKIADIDSYYRIGGDYVFVEFYKCTGRPFEFLPKGNWEQMRHGLGIVWDFSQRAGGKLWLVCFDDKREEFRLLNVLGVSNDGIEHGEPQDLTFEELKKWFQKLNSDVLNSK